MAAQEVLRQIATSPIGDGFDAVASEAKIDRILEALKRSGTEAIESVHIGDQYLGDVTGARGVGIQPILIDRDGTQVGHNDCPVIRTLTEVPDLLKALETAS